MATVKKLDKNKWEVRYDSYDTQGKRHQRRKTFPRAADARAFAASLDSSTPYEAAYTTFSEWADAWFTLQQSKLEAESIRTYRYVLKRCKSEFGRMRLTAITPAKLEAFFISLANANMATSSMRLYRAVLNCIFKYAVRDGYLQNNPLDRVEPPKGLRHEITLPDLDALKQRITALKNTPFYLPACLALFTGMRRGEIVGLRWDCVDLDNHLIHVRRVRIKTAPGINGRNDIPLSIPNLTNYISREYTKTKQHRTISIPQSLVDILRAQRIAQKEAQLRLGASYVKTDYVCTLPDGTPVYPDSITQCLKGFCRFHDLRHLNASLLLDEGYSVVAVAERIGHASPSTTLNIYAHTIKERDRQAADSLDRRIQFKA